ncbi:MFS transporter [uncultured Azohydromonas sp.]|uniref:MFS transporter n=1 Tax=uncultured Azohydromonas sp. TaxID=487342 RepID=UPI002638BE7A|nr:MFS transporter [uncultured Azohydromonas sp.]
MKPFLASSASRLFEASPLRHAQFRLFYLGSIGTALGYTMQTTIASWVMATLTPSQLMVALVQTASTAPALLFGLIAGALADIVDRRRLILATQCLLLASTAILGAATLAGFAHPALLLALTFLVGVGLCLYLPAQASSINDLVSREDLPRAVALGAVAFNVARAIGPALAGGMAAWIGSGSALLTSSLCFILMVVAVYRMKKRERALPGVPETVLSGVLSGLRFARHSPAMRTLVVRNVSFSLCAAAFWALLPVIARDQLQLGAGGFGLLSAGFGAGAITGALAIPGQLQRRSLNAVVTAGTMLWLGAIALLAVIDVVAVAILAAFACGTAWVCVLAGLSAGTQSSAPAWVRARAVSVNLVANQASLAFGSALWGAVASAAGTQAALVSSAITMLLLLAISRRARVAMGNEADVTPGAQLPELAIAVEPGPKDGPVLIQLEYRIDVEHREAFLRAIHTVEPVRRRNGAISWRVFRNLGEDGVFVERFILASWAEYVRLRARATMTDRNLLHEVEKLASSPVRISRLIGIDRESDPLGNGIRSE